MKVEWSFNYKIKLMTKQLLKKYTQTKLFYNF